MGLYRGDGKEEGHHHLGFSVLGLGFEALGRLAVGVSGFRVFQGLQGLRSRP